jgi:HK97 family phage major capsid protein
MDMSAEIIKSIQDGNKVIEGLATRMDGLEARANRLNLSSARPAVKVLAQFIDTTSRQRIAVLGADDRLEALEQKSGDLPSMGRVLRGIALGGQAHDAAELAEERKALGIGTDTAGGYTVSGALSSQWIDLLRAQMVLNRAGVTTIPMENNSLTLAKVTGDPTVS